MSMREYVHEESFVYTYDSVCIHLYIKEFLRTHVHVSVRMSVPMEMCVGACV